MLKVGVEILFLWTIKSMYCSTLHYWLKSWISRGAGGEKKLFVGFWVKNVSFYLILTVYHTLYWATIFTKNIQCSFAFLHKVLQSFCIFFSAHFPFKENCWDYPWTWNLKWAKNKPKNSFNLFSVLNSYFF